MARPIQSGASFGTVAAGNNTLTFAHTTEANKAIYFVVCANATFGGGGFNDFAVSATFNGVALNLKGKFAAVGLADVFRGFVFSLPNPAAATANVVFSGSGLAAGVWTGISAMAVNVENFPVNADVILPGGWYQDNLTSLAKDVYGWDPNGLQICAAWGALGAAGLSITEGVNIGSVSGLYVNEQDAAGGELTVTATRGGSGVLGIFSFLIPSEDQVLSGGGPPVPVFTGQFGSVFAVTGTGNSGLPYANVVN